jgi:hypothetical protein
VRTVLPHPADASTAGAPLAPGPRAEVALWVLLAIAGALPALLTPGAVVGDGVDAYGTHWFYAWMRTCVEHLGDPSRTNLFFFPLGKDHFAHTGNNLVDALASVPFQWVLGPTLYQPVFVIVLLVLNGLAFRAMARELVGEGFARFAATLLWQVNPYVTFELTAGRPTQAAFWFAPVAVLLFVRSARSGSLREGAWLGVAMALTGWLYWFNGYFVAMLLAVLAPFFLREAREHGTTPGAVLRAWGLGALVCGLVIAPMAIPMLRAIAAGDVPGVDAGGDAPANNVSSTLHGAWLTEVYGTPMLLQPAFGLTFLAAALWPGVEVLGGRRRWLVAAVVLLVLALGPAISTRTEVVLSLPWYTWLQRTLPFFVRLWFPYRMVGVALLVLVPLAGALLARSRWPRATLAGVVTAALATQSLVGTWPYNHHVMRSPRLLTLLREQGGALLFVPFRVQHDGIAWQTEFMLPMLGGMGESAPVFWPPGYKDLLGNGVIRALRAAATSGATAPDPSTAARASLDRLGYRWVVLRPSLVQAELRKVYTMRGELHVDYAAGTREAIDNVTRTVGAPPVGADEDVVLWDLRARYVPPADLRYDVERATRVVDAEAMRSRVERAMARLGRSMPQHAPRTATAPPPAGPAGPASPGAPPR